MENHIDFVQNTYNIVRRPLNYMTNQIEYLMGSNNSNLPEIKNKNDS